MRGSGRFATSNSDLTSARALALVAYCGTTIPGIASGFAGALGAGVPGGRLGVGSVTGVWIGAGDATGGCIVADPGGA
jgi:hypothetical protein